MNLKVTILGCGSSAGVPRVGVGWGVCDPNNPKNRRRRCSLLVERLGPGGTTTVLVDTSPDLREQLLGADVRRLDGVLITHDHADHIHGIDDLRPLVISMRQRIPLYTDAATGAVLRNRFGYCFVSPPGSGYPPIVDEHLLEPGIRVAIDGPGGPVDALPFDMEHGNIQALGFRFGDIAYASDVSLMPDSSVAVLADLDLLIIDALRYTPHPTHFTVDEALALIARVRPRRAVLTNLHTDLDYETLASQLPEGIVPAFDGLSITATSA